ncbi:phosphatidylinositol-glycan biosynthesis class S protein-domain-containing protein [Dunaliella salina]|nr:phosphatidylinositol-glycan biosynthesis class S protein-domain-containing protein [Dunaliella salina]|eukprot:KAF5836232.1 phosphatidylinositol-glycan biosynthesis class S protein-domain-containing protein [Dunaliella salina]
MHAQISQQAERPQRDAEDLLHVSVVHETREGCSFLTWPSKSNGTATLGPRSHAHQGPPQPSPPCLHLHHLLGQLQQLHRTAAGAAAGMDSLLHEHLQGLGATQGGQFFVFALPLPRSQMPQDALAAKAGAEARVSYQLILGQFRHAWLWYPSSTGTASSTGGGAGSDGGSEGGQAHAGGEGSLGTGSVQQQLQEVLVQVAGPALGRSFASQPGEMVRLHAPARTHGSFSAALGAYVIEPAQLPFFVDSDWSLDFGVPAVPLDSQESEGDEGAGILGTGVQSCEGGEKSCGVGGGDGILGMGAQSCGAQGVMCGKSRNDQERVGQGAGGLQEQPIVGGGTCSAVDKVGGGEGAGECPASGSHAHATHGMGAASDAHRMRWQQGRLGGGHVSHVPAHTLHMVLYIPPASRCPVVLLERRGGSASPTNSFWIPHWGGVQVMNLGVQKGEVGPGGEGAAEEGERGESGEGQRPQQKRPSDRGEVVGHELGMDALHRFAEVAVAQLRVLMGLQAFPEAVLQQGMGRSSSRGSSRVKGMGSSAGPAVRVLPAVDSGFAEWEVDVLMRRRVGRDIEAASRVLGSLSRTVLALPNLEMPNVIGQQVHEALDALHLAMLAAREGDYAAAGCQARAAHAAAEAAFSHPAILAQLSFPESHKLGVYMPLFFPALLTVALALFREVQHHVQRSRKAGKE